MIRQQICHYQKIPRVSDDLFVALRSSAKMTDAAPHQRSQKGERQSEAPLSSLFGASKDDIIGRERHQKAQLLAQKSCSLEKVGVGSCDGAQPKNRAFE